METDDEEGSSRAAEYREPSTGWADGHPGHVHRFLLWLLGMGLPTQAGLFNFLISALLSMNSHQYPLANISQTRLSELPASCLTGPYCRHTCTQAHSRLALLTVPVLNSPSVTLCDPL